MSILIKGMEMPFAGSIKTIVIYPDGTVRTRQQDPLPYTAIPVPPHGRLIDADALMGVIATNIRKADDAENYEWWNTCTVAGDFVVDAPTIIPAEGGDAE